MNAVTVSTMIMPALAVMREALAAFAHEYRLKFPIGIDRQDGRLPATMTAYEMQGTPTLVIIDRNGLRRFQHFGHADNLAVGSILGRLMAEPHQPLVNGANNDEGCNDTGCAVPNAM